MNTSERERECAIVFRHLPADDPQSASRARASVRRLCDEVGVHDTQREDVLLAASTLVSDAYRWSSYADALQLELLAVATANGPVVCVELREVGITPLPRRRERDHGLGLCVVLATDWAHGQCGWWVTDRGPTSWVIISDVSPEDAGPHFAKRLPRLRGAGDLHVVTLADLGRSTRDYLGPPCCCLT